MNGADLSHIGPYSRPPALAKLDGRTREARLMRDTRRDLIAHLGGKPSVVQAMVIDRVCNLTLRIATMDRKFAETGEMTQCDVGTYLAWSASLTRLLRQLGLKAAAPKAPSLAEVRARKVPA